MAGQSGVRCEVKFCSGGDSVTRYVKRRASDEDMLKRTIVLRSKIFEQENCNKKKGFEAEGTVDQSLVRRKCAHRSRIGRRTRYNCLQDGGEARNELCSATS